MNKLVCLASVAGVVAGVAVAGTAVQAATINIYAWAAPSLNATFLGGGSPGALTATVNGTGSFATFTSITGSTSPPGTLDLAQTIVLNLANTLANPVHVAVEVAGIAASDGYVAGNLVFSSGFANSGITTNLTVTESTHLGSVCSTAVVLGTCTLTPPIANLGSATFFGPDPSGSADASFNALTGAVYTVYDEFVFSGGAAGGNANVNISLTAAVPGPVVGAGLPGLIAACGGLLALARRRRKKAAPV